MSTPFGDLIREWRALRRFSQLDLSLEAETSARHLSFIESGRASPSRQMVLRLADALQMPKTIANAALAAAGFAPIYPQLAADAPDLAPIRAAIATMLANHEPYPAIAIDMHWDVLSANSGGQRLFTALGAAGGNIIEAMIAIGDGDAIENWEESALLALHRLRAEIAHLGGDERLKDLAARLAAHPRLAATDVASVNLNQAVIPTVFRIGGARISLFSTISQFGSVQDVNASEIRVELSFPTDAGARAWFESGAN